ncbi:hypothetical protein M2475_001804 [Breznakia sp. PF5-3]|uniref:hypothetical protein n=1 Tax=unclassified Breznakia TaxID=2623764 RepID=UPI0024066074|nr:MULTISPECIES: hypothetical protein [unclassified Breznakia]MDF9825349.1 hypothetical protein [Breznakia sp. PM6-1]MDF9836227.1 hypothetical protein [Breznakia sp. PF5-3]MDF9838533.1 hypothetical protein [Breznakia sp. PFB2-8]MDF9860472.1 hypothetical protein [Breznakia sp. PH5-24]
MIKSKQIQNSIDRLNYYDARAQKLESSYFGDETTLTFEGIDKDNILKFVGCYKVLFDHVKNYDKFRPVKEMIIPQIPYFLQKIEVEDVEIDGKQFLKCNINMFPLYIELICENISVSN